MSRKRRKKNGKLKALEKKRKVTEQALANFNPKPRARMRPRTWIEAPRMNHDDH